MIHSMFIYTERVHSSLKKMRVGMAMGLIVVVNGSRFLLFGNKSGCIPVVGWIYHSFGS